MEEEYGTSETGVTECGGVTLCAPRVAKTRTLAAYAFTSNCRIICSRPSWTVLPEPPVSAVADDAPDDPDAGAQQDAADSSEQHPEELA